MSSLFENLGDRPLADLIRPSSLSEIVGQSSLIGEKGSITKMINSGNITSFILWGPPGSGKTTIARIVAKTSGLYFESLSAVFSGVADLRKVFEAAQNRKRMGVKTLLFVDEIHRFNRSQQDSFLPCVEDGTIVLIGATTENPSFELNSALLSRMRVLTLNALDDDSLEELLKRAEVKMKKSLPITQPAKEQLIAMADGDGRYFLNMVEILYSTIEQGDNTDNNSDSDENELEYEIDTELLGDIISKKMPLYDKDREGHYSLISALHKSLRGSDVQAALYWYARMVAGGEDVHYILRRLTRFAVEDVGLADPNAIQQALIAWQTYDRLGAPEGNLAISYLVIYLATAPKSNSAYKAHNTAREVAKITGSLSPPKHIINAPTKMMSELGFGEGYEYDHDTKEGFSGQNYFPEKMQRMNFYKPIERGFEREIKKRLDYWDGLRKKKNANKNS